MEIDSKTAYPEGVQFLFPPVVYPVKEKVQAVGEERIKQLVEENAGLRAEIKALKGIIKNMNS